MCGYDQVPVRARALQGDDRMADEQTKRFSFSSDALPAQTFTVVRFRGEEELSRCYRFEQEM